MTAPGREIPRAGAGRDQFRLRERQVVQLLGTDPEDGLTSVEAGDRLRAEGPNVLPRTGRRGPLVRLAGQFHHPLIYVLLAAVAATLAVGEVVDATVILGVVLVNAAIGFTQESRAGKALEALMSLVHTEATVVRDGERHRIPSEELVPGDVVLVEAGDKVPADVRFTAVEDLHVDESALTGESLPVPKSPAPLPSGTALGDRANTGWSTTLVTRGSGRGVVVATGAGTEIGQIHRLVGEAEQLQTPLTRKIGRFSRALTVAILALAALTFLLGLVRGEPLGEMLTAAVALAVAAIPEGLPAVVTITLAIGVARMARRRAIVRHLPAVETLGSTTVICTDKTGTLTANAMTVLAVVAGNRLYSVEGSGYEPDGRVLADGGPVEPDRHPALRACLVAGALCNDSRLDVRDGRRQVLGDPTEAALVVAAEKAGLDPVHLRAESPRLDAVPFESERQWMATLHRCEDGRSVAYVKGAVERLLGMAAGQLRADGSVGPLDADAVQAWTGELTGRALRVLATGQVELPEGTGELSEELLRGRLVLTGLQGMLDPPRPRAVAAVTACREAGIRVMMITGDHAGTARAIAAEFGLADGAGPQAVTGSALAEVPDDDLPALVARTSVFARVTPEQKLRLVRALQSQGHVVAMTGDGVNDAPALRRADIGVAMGTGGTEVAREAADMVLTDDDFASIEAAVEEGRGVFDNLRKFITFMLPTSFGEALVILAAVVLATTLPVLPVQVLWINMTTAVALGLALAFEPLERDVMRRRPVPPSRPLLTGDLVGRIVLVSALMLVGAFAMFEWALASGLSLPAARTVAVNVFVLVEIGYLLNCRSMERSVLSARLPRNPWVPLGIGTTLALQALFTYAPFMNLLFGSAPLDAVWWLRVAAVAVAAHAVVEFEKGLRRRAAHRAPG